jgi:hypothetical protein
MLENDRQGSRTLNLRRRRSRLPWVYLVYQEGVKGTGRGVNITRNAPPLTPRPLPLALRRLPLALRRLPLLRLSLATEKRRHVEGGERLEAGVSRSLL